MTAFNLASGLSLELFKELLTIYFLLNQINRFVVCNAVGFLMGQTQSSNRLCCMTFNFSNELSKKDRSP